MQNNEEKVEKKRRKFRFRLRAKETEENEIQEIKEKEIEKEKEEKEIVKKIERKDYKSIRYKSKRQLSEGANQNNSRNNLINAKTFDRQINQDNNTIRIKERKN